MDRSEFQQQQQYVQPHRATTILVLGILGLICCGICAVLAWVFANNDLRKMEMGQMDNSGYETTRTGRILGIIGTALWIVGIFAYGVFGGIAALMSL